MADFAGTPPRNAAYRAARRRRVGLAFGPAGPDIHLSIDFRHARELRVPVQQPLDMTGTVIVRAEFLTSFAVPYSASSGPRSTCA